MNLVSAGAQSHLYLFCKLTFQFKQIHINIIFTLHYGKLIIKFTDTFGNWGNKKTYL